MDVPAVLAHVVPEPHGLRALGNGLWSALPADTPGQPYDRRAAAYDLVVGSRLYNRLLWGASPRRYAAFAERAVRDGAGPMLDAGCGSLVFTAAAYARSTRPLVLVDRSIGMLEAARRRLRKAAGDVPEHVVFLQADLRALPFRGGAFESVLCMGMMHLFDDVGAVTSELVRVAAPGRTLFLTSLVAERAIGARYLALLHRAGEVGTPRTQAALLAALCTTPLRGAIRCERKGSMAFVVAAAPAGPGAAPAGGHEHPNRSPRADAARVA